MSEGLNESERYLSHLCKQTFLSLWSYTNVFRQPGSELCDLLVVCGEDIIIFSDKLCKYPDTGKPELDWSRWFKKAVYKSAIQLWGAASWIKRDSSRVFLDDKCKHSLPTPIIITPNTSFHLVLVAHGAAEACQHMFGGSGSMMFTNTVKGFENHNKPFVIGDLDNKRTFVHVLDDTTLDIVLENRDTITDFTKYLTKREAFLRQPISIFSAGEEELLAYYMKSINDQGEHDFILPNVDNVEGFGLKEGIWDDFQRNPQRTAQLEADRISYLWDTLIEQFSEHAIAGTQHFVSEGGFTDSEKAIRILALESRFARRILATSLTEVIFKTPPNKRMLRVIPMPDKNLFYVLLLFPYPKHFKNITYDLYRVARQNFLEASCLVTRLINPSAQHVVGIAMESGLAPHGYSEDLIYLDCTEWTEDMERQAKKDQDELQILISPTYFERNVKEFPTND